MSDQIFINDITDCDSIIINDTVSQNVVNVVAEGSLVTSVNGRIGAIFLSKNDVGLDQVDNTSDLNKPISSATLSALVLKADLSAFNVLNNLVLSQYGSWNSVYATVNILSGNWNSVFSNVNSNSSNFLQSQTFVNSNSANILQVNSTVNSTSANWNSVYSTWNSNSSFDLEARTFVNSNSANILQVNTRVNSNSANWDYAYNTVVGGLSSDLWNSTYTNFSKQSANNISVYAYVNANSGFESNQQNVTTFVINNSSNIINVNSLVNTTSANWNYSFNWVNNNQTNATFNTVSAIALSGVFYGDGSNLIGAALPGQADVNTLVRSNSGNWNSVFSNVNSNSSNFLQSQTFVNNNSANIRQVNSTVNTTSANWNSVYSTWNSNSSFDLEARTFVNSNSANIRQVNSTVNTTSANWNSVYSNVNSNSATYATYNYVNNGFLPLSGGIISGATRINNNLTVFGNLTTTGTTTFANTIFSVTSALSVVHVGSGPALWVGNNGTGDIASFYDIDQGIEILHVGGNNGTFPNVGVKTSTPNVDFTVNGQISANNTIWSAGGDSNQWNSVYSNVNSNSSNFLQSQTFVNLNSSNILQVNSTVNSTSANWDSVYSNVNSNSSNFLQSQTFVNLNSSNILQVNSTVNSTSANWNKAYNISTEYQNTSASFATTNFTDSKYLPLTGGTITGSISSNSSFTTSGTIEAVILKISSAPATFINPLTASNSFLIINVNGVDKALQLWDFTS